MQSQSIGSVEFGQVFHFAVSNRGADGSAISDGSSGTFTPKVFDVIDNRDWTVILPDQTLYHATDRDLWFGQIDTRDVSTDQSGPFEPNRTYSIIVKQDITDDPLSENPTYFLHYNFTITGAYSARLKRILGLEGENMITDLFDYNQGNNAISFRVRIFETREDALNASPGITDVPESGEIATYTVTQTYQVGRNLRTAQVNTIDEDQGDE